MMRLVGNAVVALWIVAVLVIHVSWLVRDAVALAAALWLVAVAWHMWRLRYRVRRVGAKKWERKAPHAAEPESGRLRPYELLVGVLKGRWVQVPWQVAMLVIGPPRSGKSSCVMIPNVLAWPGAVVTTSTRADVLAATVGHRLTKGPVWLFDPLGEVTTALPATVRRLDWTPLRGCEVWDTAWRRASELTLDTGRGVENGDHWQRRTTPLLAALLHAAALDGERMSTVVRWVHESRLAVAEATLQEHQVPHALAILTGIAGTPSRERGSIWSSLSGTLASFNVTAVARSCDAARQCPFDPTELLTQGGTLYVVSPSAQLSVDLAPVVVGLVEEVRAAALTLSRATSALDRPLLLALDEVATICPLPSLPAIAAEGGGRSIVLLAAVQDVSQVSARWGAAFARGILSLAGATLVLGGCKDAALLKDLEVICGTEWVERQSRSVTWQPAGGRSSGTQTTAHETPRMSAGGIRTLAQGTALAVVEGAESQVVELAHHTRYQPLATWAATPVLAPAEAAVPVLHPVAQVA